nr:hypothetical protein CFP56_21746 [Quercus suber]
MLFHDLPPSSLRVGLDGIPVCGGVRDQQCQQVRGSPNREYFSFGFPCSIFSAATCSPAPCSPANDAFVHRWKADLFAPIVALARPRPSVLKSPAVAMYIVSVKWKCAFVWVAVHCVICDKLRVCAGDGSRSSRPIHTRFRAAMISTSVKGPDVSDQRTLASSRRTPSCPLRVGSRGNQSRTGRSLNLLRH